MSRLFFGSGLTGLRVFEIVVAVCLALMLVATLVNYWPIELWRHDSMYYVTTYDNKLSEEGRWINYFLFDYLRQVPGQLAVWLSYLGIAWFAYAMAFRYTNEALFSLVFSLLICQIPILPSQLQWPETLLPAFILLGLSPLLARLLPIYVFFPLLAILFFATFSTFYFLLPLLFLKDLDNKALIKIVLIWVVSFCIGYLVTNGVVFYLTGDDIQIAKWRNPNYVDDLSSLIENLRRVYEASTSQLFKISWLLFYVLPLSLFVFGVFSAWELGSYKVLALGILCASGVYVSTIPVGIYIQERTLVTLFFGLCVALLLRRYNDQLMAVVAYSLILVLGARMAMLGNEVINWYKSNVNNIEKELVRLLPGDPTQVMRVFLVTDPVQAANVFLKYDQENGVRKLFNESLAQPLYWTPVLNRLKFQHVRVCTNFQSEECASIKAQYNQRTSYATGEGMFIAWKIEGNDMILTINPNFIH